MADVDQESIGLYEDLIRPLVTSSTYVKRTWLDERVRQALNDVDCRFVLLIGEPGAGKTGLMAGLAHENPNWLRYFIRRDSQTPLSAGDARSFLFAIGQQFASNYPAVFKSAPLEIVVKQRVSTVSAEGKVQGIAIDDLRVSPFYHTALRVEQNADLIRGELQGIIIKQVVAEPRFLEIDNLQHLALLDPADAMLIGRPDAQIVILLDALDELRYQAGNQINVLRWLAACPELPPNTRFVITSRPDEQLALFRKRQHRWLRELAISPQSPDVHADLLRYAQGLVQWPGMRAALESANVDVAQFIDDSLKNADGNFQYLAALSRAMRKAVGEGDQQLLARLVHTEKLPVGLEELYGFFLSALKDQAEASGLVEVRGTTPLESIRVPAWQTVYQPVLGILSVAKEPLGAEQIHMLARITGDFRITQEAIHSLSQFLDHENTSYRLFHASFADFLIAPETRNRYPQCYLDPLEWHRKVIACYRTDVSSWKEINWDVVDDYSLRHLASHLYELARADRATKQDQLFYRRLLNELICQPYMRAKRARTYAHQSLHGDVQLAIDLVSTSVPCDWSELARLSLLTATLGELATNLPAIAFDILPRIGHFLLGQGFARLFQDRYRQADAYLRLAGAELDQGHKDTCLATMLLALQVARKLNEESMPLILARLGEGFTALNYVEGIGETVALAERVTNTFLRQMTLRDVATSIAGADPRLARRLAESIEEKSQFARAQAYSGIATSLPPADADSMFQQAIEIARSVTDLGDRCSALTCIVRDLAKVGRQRKAHIVLDEYLTTATALPDAKAKWSAMVTIIELSAAIGDRDQAAKLVESLPDQTKLTALESLVGRDRRSEAVNDSLTEHTHRAWAIAEKISERRAGDEAMRAAVGMLARNSEFDRARDVASQIRDNEIRIGAETEIIVSLGYAGCFEQAFEMAATDSHASNPHLKCELAGALEKHKRTNEALQLVLRAAEMTEQLRCEGESIGGLSDLGQAMHSVGLICEAKEVAERVLDAAIKTPSWYGGTALARIVPLLVRAGNHAMLEKVQAACQDSSYPGPRVDRFLNVGKSLFQCGEIAISAACFKAARELAESATECHVRTEKLAATALVLAQCGSDEGAWQIVQGLVSQPDIAANASPGLLRPLAGFYGQVAREDGLRSVMHLGSAQLDSFDLAELFCVVSGAYRIMKLNEEAKRVVMEALPILEATGADPADDLRREHAICEVVIALAELREFPRAVEMADRMSFEHERDFANRGIMQAFLNADQMDKARQATERISDARLKARSLADIARACSRDRGDDQATNQLLIEALEQARSSGRCAVFDIIGLSAEVLAKVNGPDLLRKIYDAICELEHWWGTEA